MYRKTIALVAHDNRKVELMEWVKSNADALLQHNLICTGTTGTLVEKVLRFRLDPDERHKLVLHKLKSGPLGGDQQLGGLISEDEIDLLIFFWDPMEPQPHDVDVKALLRIAVLYNVPIAQNISTADYLITSPLFFADYPVIHCIRSS